MKIPQILTLIRGPEKTLCTDVVIAAHAIA